MMILSGPTRTSLTSSRRTRWRSATVAAAALFCRLVRKSSRLSASCEIDVSVGELGVEGVDLLAQAGLAGAQLGHPGPEFVEGDQLFLVGADEPCDGLAGLGQPGVEAFALDGGGVGGAGLGEPLGDLGADQRRVGEQGR